MFPGHVCKIRTNQETFLYIRHLLPSVEFPSDLCGQTRKHAVEIIGRTKLEDLCQRCLGSQNVK
jgi:hypothetical protein